jgi:hypothetical protein
MADAGHLIGLLDRPDGASFDSGRIGVLRQHLGRPETMPSGSIVQLKVVSVPNSTGNQTLVACADSRPKVKKTESNPIAAASPADASGQFKRRHRDCPAIKLRPWFISYSAGQPR